MVDTAEPDYAAAPSMGPAEHLLAPLCAGWRGMIKRAVKAKAPFQEDADECMAFLCESHDFLWQYGHRFGFNSESDKEIRPPDFQMTINKTHEFRAVVGPVLYARNPVRTCTPRVPFVVPQELAVDQNLAMQMDQLNQMAMGTPQIVENPQFMAMYQQVQAAYQQQMAAWQQQAMTAQQQSVRDKTGADLLARVLNYTPNELDLSGNAKDGIDEALIKGRGVWFVEYHTPPGSTRRMPGSFYYTVDHLLIDPDAESLKNAKWIALRCVHPYWEIERDYELPRDSLKPYCTLESGRSQGEREGDRDAVHKRANGQTNDLLVYWKIWSKMGMGGRMTDVPEAYKEPLERFGDYCYLVVAEGCPFLLNVPDELLNTEPLPDEDRDATLQAQVTWPIEAWRDHGRWPCVVLDFYHKPRSAWPYSPMQPGIGYLKFMVWGMSFLATHIKTSLRTLIAMDKTIDPETEDDILHGPDFTRFKVAAQNRGLKDLVAFIEHPQVNKDAWTILAAAGDFFDKATGLTELAYGMTDKQMRSSQEAGVKAQQLSIRPDYMASQTEQAMSELARLEAFAARKLAAEEIGIADIVPGAEQWWDTLVKTDDLDYAAREFDVRIEAGSARRPNRERDTDNMNQIMPVLMPVYTQYAAATGNYQPLNNLVSQLFTVLEKDPAGLMLPDIPMMPPPQQGGEEGSGQEQEQEQPA